MIAGRLYAALLLCLAHFLLGNGAAWARPKIGLALGGGGSRGAAHVGVLRILEQQNIPIDYIAGTNVGAVVGGLYSAGVSLSALQEMFVRKSLMNAYLNIPIKVKLLATPVRYIPRLLGRKSYDGLYSGARLARFLNKYVPEAEQNIEDLKITFGAVALNLTTGELRTFRTGNLGAALEASSAIPVLKKPVKLGDSLYVDGGVVTNLPVEQVKAMGADLVIAVDLDGKAEKMTEADFFKIGSVSHRVLTLHFSKVDEEQVEKADLVLRPEVTGIGLISTAPEGAQEAIAAGERAALASVDSIRALIHGKEVDGKAVDGNPVEERPPGGGEGSEP